MTFSDFECKEFKELDVFAEEFEVFVAAKRCLTALPFEIFRVLTFSELKFKDIKELEIFEEEFEAFKQFSTAIPFSLLPLVPIKSTTKSSKGGVVSRAVLLIFSLTEGLFGEGNFIFETIDF